MPVNPQETPWTDIRVAMLLDLWGTKNSCNWIAGEINRQTGSMFTRNAIIGKVNRLGLAKRKIVRQASSRPKKPRNRRIRPERVVVDLFADALPPPDFLGIAFVETDNKTCMYSEGDGAHMLFCGQPRKDESSYCPYHHQRCWVKPTGKRTVKWKLWGRAA